MLEPLHFAVLYSPAFSPHSDLDLCGVLLMAFPRGQGQRARAGRCAFIFFNREGPINVKPTTYKENKGKQKGGGLCTSEKRQSKSEPV